MSYSQEVMELARLVQWSLLRTNREYTPSRKKKKRHRVELMLRKVKVFFVKAPRGGTCSAHTKTTGNIRKYLAAIMLTQENFLYPDV